MAVFLLTLASAATAAPLSAHACGFCANDKAASVYSYDSIQWAQAHAGRYVVASVVGTQTQADFERAVRALKTQRGVAGQTVKSAFAQHAVSFVWKDPSRDPSTIQNAFSPSKDGFSLQILAGVGQAAQEGR